LKQVPEVSSELAAICSRKMIAVSGILTMAGKLEQLSVKKSPDSQAHDALTEALSNWTSALRLVVSLLVSRSCSAFA